MIIDSIQMVIIIREDRNIKQHNNIKNIEL